MRAVSNVSCSVGFSVPYFVRDGSQVWILTTMSLDGGQNKT